MVVGDAPLSPSLYNALGTGQLKINFQEKRTEGDFFSDLSDSSLHQITGDF